MWSALKTVGLVTLVALLIWLWAEAEGLRPAATPIRIQFVAPSEDVSVKVLDPEFRGDAVLRYEGSTIAINEVEQVLRSPLRLSPGVGGVPGEPGEHVVRLADVLRTHPDLARRGVTIQDVQPANVTIRVSRLVTLDLPVRPDLRDLEIDGDVTVSPATVQVMMPTQAATLLGERGTVGGGAGGAAYATARIDEDERRLLRDDGPQTVQAQIVLPEVLGDFEPVRVFPQSVRVTLRVRKQTDEIVIPTVPVWITMPHTEGTDWDVRVQDGLIRNVTVRGPTDQIARVRSRELVPIAFVVLSSDDLEAGVTSKLAVFAPVPSYVLDSARSGVGVAGGGAPPRMDAAMLEQLAPLQYSAENRRVGLAIQKRQTGGSAGVAPSGAGG